MPVLHQYQNGNCQVTLHENGSKAREWPDGAEPLPEFPESVDLKITNQCDKACAWCHESATKDGKHASVGRVVEAVAGLPAGVEIAIGGGNPPAYPSLLDILRTFREKGLIANMTIQGGELFSPQVRMRITYLQRERLLYGVGLSDPAFYSVIADKRMLPANAVCHVIVGIDDPWRAIALRAAGCNVLVLGYKRYGRGADHYTYGVEKNMARWRYFTRTILRKAEGVLSFDNLALKQLDIRNRIPTDVWSKHYMGDDGAFTMYFDAVKNQYAGSSVGERKDAGSMTLAEMFHSLPTCC